MAQIANGEAAATDDEDSVKWLALLLRQGLKVIVVGIEKKYGLREATQAEAKARRQERQAA